MPGASRVHRAARCLREVTYELLLHNNTLTPLARFWKAAADLAAGKTLTAADAAVLQQVFAPAPPPSRACPRTTRPP